MDRDKYHRALFYRDDTEPFVYPYYCMESTLRWLRVWPRNFIPGIGWI